MMIEDNSQDIDTGVQAFTASDFHIPSASVVKTNDVFMISGDELQKVSGLGASFRRKMNRTIQKRFVGIEGVETQQNLLAQAITGYAIDRKSTRLNSSH